MDIPAMLARVNQLWVHRRDELVRKTQHRQREILQESASRGISQSSNTVLLLAELHTDNFRDAVPEAWNLLTDTHRAMGSDVSAETRAAIKSWMSERIKELKNSASAQIAHDLTQYGARLQNKAMLERTDNTESIAHALDSRYAAIIDNYIDQLRNVPMTQSPVTINAQNIGAVLTGDRATAHVTQNAGTVAQMRELVELMGNVLKHEPGLDERKKGELMEIVDDTRVELDKPAPNETKLMTLFTLLTQSVQTLPAAKPAYDAAKVLLASFGISLP
jgi:hypothetical protein